jgi:hypothetical protein
MVDADSLVFDLQRSFAKNQGFSFPKEDFII